MNELNSPFRPSQGGSFSLFARLRKSGKSPRVMKKWFYWFLILLTGALIHDFGFTGQSVDAAPATSTQDVTKQQEGNSSETKVNSSVEKKKSGGGGHSDPVAPVLISIALILLLAKLGGDVAERISMPAVLGELVVGVLLGNVALMTGYHGLDFLKPAEKATSQEVTHVETTTDKTKETEAKKEEAPAEAHIGGIDTGTILQMLAGIGVVLLLFEVGLESSVREMMQVGLSSFLVAILGVVVPMLMG